MQRLFEGLYARWCTAGLALIVLLVPFHAVFTTWLGAELMHADVFRIWKDVLLVLICAVGLGVIVLNVRLRSWLFSSLLRRLMFAFCSFLLAMTLYGLARQTVSPSAALYGLIVDGRLFAAFIAAALAAKLSERSPRAKNSSSLSGWKFIMLGPLVLVVVFGVLQASVLPRDFLTHFGYGPSTIPAVHLVDNKPRFIRLQATLRGPNPLGAYLVALVPLALVLTWRRWSRLSSLLKAGAIVFGLATAIVFFGTYSRSAWVGMVIAISALLLCSVRLPRYRRFIYMAALCGLVIFGGLVYALRNTDYFQNVVFHTSEHSEATQSSNEQRFDGLSRGIEEVKQEPFGRGVGSAGPASARNTSGPGRIAENFFVQIAQETGLIGISLFMAAYTLVGVQLFKRRHDPVGAALFGSFIGLTFINLVSHAWADDTLAYVCWIPLGIYLTEPAKRATLKHKRTSQLQGAHTDAEDKSLSQTKNTHQRVVKNRTSSPRQNRSQSRRGKTGQTKR